MYSLSYFKENDKEKVLEFMYAHPFVTVCGSDAKGTPVATQIPVLIKERPDGIYMLGHFMKKTDHHLAFEENPLALALFTGPHSYVSASWYSDAKQASTWNYMTVHARGTLRFLDDAELPAILRETTELFENNPASPASYDQLLPEYVSRLSTAIVAFEIKVESLNNVFKLSQNRDKASYMHIIERLDEQGGDAALIAKEMKDRVADLYKFSQD